ALERVDGSRSPLPESDLGEAQVEDGPEEELMQHQDPTARPDKVRQPLPVLSHCTGNPAVRVPQCVGPEYHSRHLISGEGGEGWVDLIFTEMLDVQPRAGPGHLVDDGMNELAPIGVHLPTCFDRIIDNK